MDKTHPDPTLATDILQCNVFPLLDIILLLTRHLLLLHWVSGGSIMLFFIYRWNNAKQIWAIGLCMDYGRFIKTKCIVMFVKVSQIFLFWGAHAWSVTILVSYFYGRHAVLKKKVKNIKVYRFVKAAIMLISCNKYMLLVLTEDTFFSKI